MYDFPFELDEFQKKACDLITQEKSVVVCAPTGAGKTVIAQHAIHCALKSGKRVFYTTPLKALSNQKYNDFSEKSILHRHKPAKKAMYSAIHKYYAEGCRK